jgi:hypothetical protein
MGVLRDSADRLNDAGHKVASDENARAAARATLRGAASGLGMFLFVLGVFGATGSNGSSSNAIR